MNQMAIKDADFGGVKIITPFSSIDNRGIFVKDYSADYYEKCGVRHTIKEIFISESKRGVVRGLHYQTDKPQSKFVRCVKGKIFDVVVDLRTNSATYGKWKSFVLTEGGGPGILIPVGFAHGFLALEDSIVIYECDEGFYPSGDSGLCWNDPDLGIEWPLDNMDVIISDKDQKLQSFEEYEKGEKRFTL